MTVTIKVLADDVELNVDFVPVIEFTHPKWPPHHVRKLDDELIQAKVLQYCDICHNIFYEV
jgi:hypothetical protein